MERPRAKKSLRASWVLLSILVSISCLLATLRSPLFVYPGVASVEQLESGQDQAVVKQTQLGRVPAARPVKAVDLGDTSDVSLASSFHAPSVALAIPGEPRQPWHPVSPTPYELMVLLN